ncbi:hypothetical protein HPB48_026116 [Haemaphysalis longicornis]|uniref:Uncharacterized protein n=1 Tax=Haemaphysalis longicornis TaxID=44386 RepID=A0A9J6HAM4_HAELO|nr:hypothetical protein HPB48_026116 [Haemaphysalis longicornis]
MYNYHHQHTKCALANSPSPVGSSRCHARQWWREVSEEFDAWDEVTEELAVGAAVTFEDCVQYDDEACTSAERTTEGIVNTVRCDDGTSAEDAYSDAETGTASESAEDVCNANVLQCVAKMRTFLSRCKNAIEACSS